MNNTKSRNIEKRLIKYYYYFNKKNWRAARNILLSLVKKGEKGFWIYTSISACTYAMRDYKNALKYSKIAYKINPKSPLVLWDYAGLLIMLNKETDAIKFYKRILSKTPEETGKVQTTAGIRWAKSLLNDCRFKMGLSYFRIYNDKLAKKYFSEHLKNRKSGLPSLFSKNDVKYYLKRLNLN